MKPSQLRSCVLLLLAVLGIVAAFATLLHSLDDPLLEGRKNVSLRECSKNLTKIQRAIEQYSTDREGQLPQNLDQLTPTYLRDFPQCSAARQDTYSAGYRVHESGVFALCCPEQFVSSDEACKANRVQLEQELGAKKKETGRYPRTLTALTRCPVHKLALLYSPPQNTYSLCCRGAHHVHQEIPENHPRRDRVRGFQSKP